MEPISFTAIVAFLGYKVAGETVSEAVKDAYKALKGKLSGRFGDESEVVKAVDILEKKPDSEARRVVLQEEIESAAVDQDLEIREMAQGLLDQIESQPGVDKHIQQACGNYIAQADHGSTASINVKYPKELPEE